MELDATLYRSAWVAQALRVLCMTSRYRGLSLCALNGYRIRIIRESRLGVTSRPTRQTPALPQHSVAFAQ